MVDRKTILVVDDEPDVRFFLSTLFEDNGYDVVVAQDGNEGLARLEERPPDLITLDVTMPEKSGVGLYREMRLSDRWKSIPVVMITGVAPDFERFISTRRRVPPPDAYFPKPVDKDALLTRVKELLAS